MKSKVQCPIALQMADDRYTEDKEQCALLLESFFPDSSPSEQLYDNRVPCRKEEWELVKALIIKLKWTIDSFRAFKSPTIDGISLQRGTEKILPHLTKNIVATGYIPRICSSVKVGFSSKIGRKDATSLKSNRLISLPFFMIKAMEKVIIIMSEQESWRGCPYSHVRTFTGGKIHRYPLLELMEIV